MPIAGGVSDARWRHAVEAFQRTTARKVCWILDVQFSHGGRGVTASLVHYLKQELEQIIQEIPLSSGSLGIAFVILLVLFFTFGGRAFLSRARMSEMELSYGWTSQRLPLRRKPTGPHGVRPFIPYKTATDLLLPKGKAIVESQDTSLCSPGQVH